MNSALDGVEGTALLTAALRAAESRREDRLYDDPFAAGLAGGTGLELLAQIRAVTFPPNRPRHLPSTPDYNAIRTRFLDDHLQRTVREGGFGQLVLAPAGMDSRAYRLDWPDGLRIFEVDRPAVLDYKRDRLDGAPPRAVHRTVAADLTGDTWERDLAAAGYDPAAPSVWLLEGLLYYLPEEAVHQVMSRVSAIAAPGSRIAADLVNHAALTLPQMRDLLDVFARWGCPWLFGTDTPEELFAAYGWQARAIQPGEPEADYGRWPDPVPDRAIRDVRRVFFVSGVRQ